MVNLLISVIYSLIENCITYKYTTFITNFVMLIYRERPGTIKECLRLVKQTRKSIHPGNKTADGTNILLSVSDTSLSFLGTKKLSGKLNKT